VAAMRRALLDRAGVAAIEFAILGPVLLVLLIGIIEFGRLLWLENALQYAVAQASRCVTIDTSVCGSTRETQDFAASSSGMSFPSAIFLVGPAACGNLVSASYPFTFAAGLFPYAITLTAQSCYPV
jgi:Flp pilus assembly protein TadG